MRDVEDLVVAFLLVHGFQDLAHFGTYGGVVTLSPVEERVVASGCGIEGVWASHSHDPRVMLDEGLGNAACS